MTDSNSVSGRDGDHSIRRRRRTHNISEDTRLVVQLAKHPSSLGMPLEAADQLSTAELQLEMERLLTAAKSGFEYGLEHFSGDECTALLAGMFYRFHYPFHLHECLCLSRALRRSPSVDSRFYIYSRLRRLNESDGSGLGPIERIMFDQGQKQAAQLKIDAYRLLQQLWNVLSEGMPDLQSVESTGVHLQDTLEQIEEAYTKLLALHPTSTKTLRAYAQHLIDLQNQTEKGVELLQKANRLEESNRRDRSQQQTNVVFGASTQAVNGFTDNAAIVCVSGAPANIGEVMTASQAACRLLGYTRTSFVGQNVSIIIPPPLKSSHDMIMNGFAKKRSSLVVGH